MNTHSLVLQKKLLTCCHGHDVWTQEHLDAASRLVPNLDVHVHLRVWAGLFYSRLSLDAGETARLERTPWLPNEESKCEWTHLRTQLFSEQAEQGGDREGLGAAEEGEGHSHDPGWTSSDRRLQHRLPGAPPCRPVISSHSLRHMRLPHFHPPCGHKQHFSGPKQATLSTFTPQLKGTHLNPVKQIRFCNTIPSLCVQPCVCTGWLQRKQGAPKCS